MLLLEFQNAVVETQGRKTFLVGKFLQANQKNKNNRLYPDGVLHEAVEARRGDIKAGSLYGTLGHPKDGVADPARVSHVITHLDRKGDAWFGKARLLDEGCGKIAHAIIASGGRLGMSSRGSGNLKKAAGHDLVESYQLHGVDAVLDPSTPGAHVKKVMEGLPFHERLIVESVASDTLQPPASDDTFDAVAARNGFTTDPMTAELFAGHAGFPSLPAGPSQLERMERANIELLRKLAAIQDKIDMTQDGLSRPSLKKYVDALKRGNSLTAQQTLRREIEEEIHGAIIQFQAYKILSKGVGPKLHGLPAGQSESQLIEGILNRKFDE